MIIRTFLSVWLAISLSPVLPEQTPAPTRIGHAEWELPPATFEEFTSASDAVVRVRIKSRRPWRVPNDDDKQPPYVAYTAVLVEALKNHPELTSSPGADITFVELGGETVRGAEVIKSLAPVSLHPGDDAIVFLRWTPGFDSFQVKSGPHGIYRIADSKVSAGAPSELGRRGESMGLNALLSAVRTAARQKR